MAQKLDSQENDRRKDRKSEWGEQFDKWLIYCARNSSPIILSFSVGIPDLLCVPLRIDKTMMEVSTEENGNMWVNKSYIVSCKSDVAE